MSSTSPRKDSDEFWRAMVLKDCLWMNVELAHTTVGRNNNLYRSNRSVDIAQYGCVCTDGNIN